MWDFSLINILYVATFIFQGVSFNLLFLKKHIENKEDKDMFYLNQKRNLSITNFSVLFNILAAIILAILYFYFDLSNMMIKILFSTWIFVYFSGYQSYLKDADAINTFFVKQKGSE